VEKKGFFDDADLAGFQTRIAGGVFDACDSEHPKFTKALNRVFQENEAVDVSGDAVELEGEEEGVEDGMGAAAAAAAGAGAGDAAVAAGAGTGAVGGAEFLSPGNPICFRIGDSKAMNVFSSSFLSWSREKLAQLCLCDPPWGMRGPTYDKEWSQEGWVSFAREVDRCMDPTGVVLLFLPHNLFHHATVAFTSFGWRTFHQPLVWVHKPHSKAFKFSKEPFSAHCLILPFVKSKEFLVEINQDLETALGFGTGTNLYHNVFITKPTAAWRMKPKTAEPDVEEVAEDEAAAPEQPTARRMAQRFRVEQKPVELLQMLIRRYAPGKNDIVIDPTFGTGSAGIATYLTSCDERIGQRYFFGMDSDHHALGVATMWLDEVKAKG
jgi:pyruvate/2-oxoglutarate dehydrogenase complex dihydrolipoamide acyltransferase (E2) component